MALKGRLTKAEYDALADPFKEHYLEQDDAFVLQAEGYIPATRLDEFRENNRTLNRNLEAAKAALKAFDGVDPAEHKRLKEEVERLGKAPVKTDQELEERIGRLTKPLNDKVDALIVERDTLKAKNEAQGFATLVQNAATKAGIQADFMPDVLNRARTAGFKLVDENEVRGFRPGTDEQLRDDAGKEITLDRFVREQPSAFFGKTTGSNPAPGSRSAGPQGSGTIKKLYNPSPAEQGRHSKEIAAGTVEVVRDA